MCLSFTITVQHVQKLAEVKNRYDLFKKNVYGLKYLKLKTVLNPRKLDFKDGNDLTSCAVGVTISFPGPHHKWEGKVPIHNKQNNSKSLSLQQNVTINPTMSSVLIFHYNWSVIWL